MCKRGSIVCKLRPFLPKGQTNPARMRTIVTGALQRQYLQTELNLWIRLVCFELLFHILCYLLDCLFLYVYIGCEQIVSYVVLHYFLENPLCQ
jgi:hypothetical protein